MVVEETVKVDDEVGNFIALCFDPQNVTRLFGGTFGKPSHATYQHIVGNVETHTETP